MGRAIVLDDQHTNPRLMSTTSLTSNTSQVIRPIIQTEQQMGQTICTCSRDGASDEFPWHHFLVLLRDRGSTDPPDQFSMSRVEKEATPTTAEYHARAGPTCKTVVLLLVAEPGRRPHCDGSSYQTWRVLKLLYELSGRVALDFLASETATSRGLWGFSGLGGGVEGSSLTMTW